MTGESSPYWAPRLGLALLVAGLLPALAVPESEWVRYGEHCACRAESERRPGSPFCCLFCGVAQPGGIGGLREKAGATVPSAGVWGDANVYQ